MMEKMFVYYNVLKFFNQTDIPQTLYTTDFSFFSKLKFLPGHTFENTEYHGTEYLWRC